MDPINSLKKVTPAITLLACLFLTFSTHAQSYIPNVVQSPIFSNEGEFQIRVNGGTSGIDPQLSYAVTERFGLMLNTSIANNTDDESASLHIHKMGELGIGWYKNTNGKFVLEAFAGYGLGNVEAVFRNSLVEYISTASMQKIFIQPSVGFVTDIFDISATPRFSAIFYNIDNESDLETNTLFFEPTITAAAGYRYVKFQVQLGGSIPFSEETNLAFTHESLILNIGLSGRIGRKYF